MVALSGWFLACVLVGADHHGLVDLRPFLAKGPSLDPDEPRFELATEGPRLRGMLGGQLGLWGVDHARFRYVLAISSFVQLVNLQPQGVPWETYRASIGLDTFWRPRTSADVNVIVQFGWHHESDHAANIPAYLRLFTVPGRQIDNGGFSAFEYFKARVDYRHRWTGVGAPRLETTFAPGLRAFTPSINPSDAREPVVGLQGELRFDVTVHPIVSVWAAGYGEWVHNRFDASDHGVLSDADDTTPPVGPRPYLTRRVRVGTTIVNRPRTLQFVPQIGYENSNGRGLDFMRRWGHAVFFALTFHR